MVKTRSQSGIVKQSYKKKHSVKVPRKKSTPIPKGFKHTMTEKGAKNWINDMFNSLPDTSVDDLTKGFKRTTLGGGTKSKRRRRRSRRRQYTKKR